MDEKRLQKLQAITDWEISKPSKDSDWAEDVKKENLDVKYDYQLEEMLESHASKIERVEKDLDEFTNWPQVRLHGITKQFEQMFKDAEVEEGGTLEGKTLQEWIDEEFESQQLYYTWKVAKLDQSVERIAKEIELRAKGFLEVQDSAKIEAGTPERESIDVAGSQVRNPLGTTYYVDADNGNDGDAGTHPTTSPWANLDTFTEAARSAGDICIVRRGMTNQIDNGSDLTFTSDGTIANPIIIEADYDDVWGDETDLSGTGTAILIFGSKTVTFSADVSGVLAAGDWIYASGDNNREFAYEVASVSTVTVTLYLPYKGNQAGSGRTMFNMQSTPIWNTASGAFQWNIDAADCWKIQGLHIRGSDTNGVVEIDSCQVHIFIDCIFEASSTNDFGVKPTDDAFLFKLHKVRFFACQIGLSFNIADTFGKALVTDSLLDGNSITSSLGIGAITTCHVELFIKDSEFLNHATADVNNIFLTSSLNFRNCLFSSSTAISSITTSVGTVIGLEDYQRTISDSRFHQIGAGLNLNTSLFQSETTTVRSGGSNVSIKVIPTTNMTTIWDFNKLMVFELPIYATIDSKTYTVYFKTNDIANWTADPTVSELWIELEAWGHATNNFRKITKSTGTIDFNGSTSWQALSVTVAPAQAGVAYLRCWYAKTKETPSNVFFVDPVPVIS